MRKDKKVLFLGGFLAILAVLGMCTTTAWAKGRLKGSVDTSFGFNSNPELMGEKEKFGFEFTVNPYIGIGITGRKGYAEVGYGLGYSNVFGDSTWEVNTHEAIVLLRYDLSPRISIGIMNTLDVLEMPETSGDTLGINTFGTSVRKQMGSKLTLGGGYNYQTFEDDSNMDSFSDYGEHEFSLDLDYIITPKLRMNLDGGYHHRGFDGDTKDYDAFNGSVGLAMTFGTRCDISGEIGSEARDYDASKDISSVTAKAKFNMEINRKTLFSVSYDYGLQDTYIVTTDRTAELLQPAIISLVTLNNLDRFYSAMKTHRTISDLALKFTDKDTIDFFTAYQFSEAGAKYYLGTGGDENIDEDSFEVGANYFHQFNKDFFVSMNYTYGQRDSNRRGDYGYNVVTIGLHSGF